MGSKCLSMKSGNSVLSLFLLVLLVSLLLPEADCWGVRGRALANRRIARKGPVRGSQGHRQRKQAGRPLRRRGKEDYPPDVDAATIDESAPADAVASSSGEGAAGGLCEVLMFDRGEGTYSLQFIQNKC